MPEMDLYWSAFLTIGMLAHTMHATKLQEVISDGLCDPTDAEKVKSRMVTFASAGVRSLLATRIG